MSLKSYFKGPNSVQINETLQLALVVIGLWWTLATVHFSWIILFTLSTEHCHGIFAYPGKRSNQSSRLGTTRLVQVIIEIY